jgi:hydantoinase/carbamoylase family amidase
LAHAIEIVAFCDEEGVRFGVTMIGSAAMSGRFDDTWLTKRGIDGLTMREALLAFGAQPEAYATVKRDFSSSRTAGRIACFVESHIEQGPVLLNEGLPVGVVTAIAGSSRVKVGVTGLAGHAGTVPMPLRQDALTAAAEMALAIERIALSRADRIVATVGKFNVAGGGAINVIPGDVDFTIDLRSGDDAVRRETLGLLEQACVEIAARRKVTLDWNPFFELPAAPCNAALQSQIAAAIKTQGVPVRYLPSGAGHDAMEFAALVPTAMLFVRCGNGGISHNPLEIMTAEDAEISTAVLLHFFENFQAVSG